MSAQNFNFAPK